MSQFATLIPTLTPREQYERELDQSMPMWLKIVLSIIGGTPPVLVLLYWTGRLKCDKVMVYFVWLCVAQVIAFCVVLAFFYQYATKYPERMPRDMQ